MSEKIGLVSLSNKINAIESSLNMPSGKGFADLAIQTVNKTKMAKMKEDLEHIEQTYVSGLKNSDIDIDEPIENLTKIVHYSVAFVEANAGHIAKLLAVDLCSAFKLDTCVSLITQILKDAFPNNSIIKWIEHMVGLLFPKPVRAPSIDVSMDSDQVSITKKKNSLKRAGGFILKKSGCH